MKKILSGFIFILLPLFLAVPGFMGWQTEQYMNSTADQVNAVPGYKAHWQHYDRGWFTSKGILLLELSDLEHMSVDGQPVILPIEFNLKHGPFLVSNGFKLGWFSLEVLLNDEQDQYLKSLVVVAAKGPLYRLTADMNLFGETELADRWLPFTHTTPQGSLQVQSLTGNGSIGIDRQFHYRFSLPSITLTPKDALPITQLNALSATINIDLSRWQSANVAPGQISFMVSDITNNSTLNISGLNATITTEINPEQTLFSSVSKISLDKLVAQTGAEPLMLSAIQIDIGHSNISIDFLEKYQALMASVEGDVGADFIQQNVGDLVLKSMLPYSPQIAINNLSFTATNGSFSLQSLLSVDGSEVVTANLNPQNPLGLAPYLIFNLHAISDKAAILDWMTYYLRHQASATEGAIDEVTLQQNASAMFDAMVAQGFIKVTPDKVNFDFNLAKGQATLNGAPYPLPF